MTDRRNIAVKSLLEELASHRFGRNSTEIIIRSMALALSLVEKYPEGLPNELNISVYKTHPWGGDVKLNLVQGEEIFRSYEAPGGIFTRGKQKDNKGGKGEVKTSPPPTEVSPKPPPMKTNFDEVVGDEW